MYRRRYFTNIATSCLSIEQGHTCVPRPCSRRFLNFTSKWDILYTGHGLSRQWCDWTRFDWRRPISVSSPARGRTARPALAALSGKVARLMIVAALAGPRPAYVLVQGDDRDVHSGAARQRYIALKLSNSHRFQYTNASISIPPTATFPKSPPEGIEAVFAPLVKYLDIILHRHKLLTHQSISRFYLLLLGSL